MFLEEVTREDTGGTHEQHGGFTFLEGLVTIAVISVIAGVVLPSVYQEYEKARLATCLAELDGMRAAVSEIGDDGYVPTPQEYWSSAFPTAGPGAYYFMVDSEDHNRGVGNDLDDCDEELAGQASPCRQSDIKYVVLCTHDHGSLGSYCFATDREPARIVSGSDVDPGYLRFSKQPNDDGTAKQGKAPMSMSSGKK